MKRNDGSRLEWNLGRRAGGLDISPTQLHSVVAKLQTSLRTSLCIALTPSLELLVSFMSLFVLQENRNILVNCAPRDSR